MSLAMVAPGEIREICDFKGKEEMKRRLKDLGFIKGQTVHVLGENQDGLILLVKGVKIAVNKGLAQMIIVK
jgi:ferrous iron transport protein A